MTLNEVRAQIDAIDPKIKALFLERMDASYHVAKVKFEAGETNIFRADREQEIIARLTDDVVPERKEEYTAIVRKVMEVSRKYQYGLMYDWDPELFTPLAEGIDIRPEHRLVKVRLTRPDVCNSMSSILSMIGDYGINMEEMRLLEINEKTSTVTFELTIRGNLLEVPMRKLMFQLSKECSTFRILESF